jgi:hypothetical protein
MALSVTKADVWSVEIPDAPGGLADKLAGLAEADVNLQFVIARRQPDKPGRGLAFVSGLKGAKAPKAAQAAGFQKSAMAALRVDAPDKPGLVRRLLEPLAESGINVRGVSASVIGRNCAIFLAFDSEADATQAAKLLRKQK